MDFHLNLADEKFHLICTICLSSVSGTRSLIAPPRCSRAGGLSSDLHGLGENQSVFPFIIIYEILMRHSVYEGTVYEEASFVIVLLIYSFWSKYVTIKNVRLLEYRAHRYFVK